MGKGIKKTTGLNDQAKEVAIKPEKPGKLFSIIFALFFVISCAGIEKEKVSELKRGTLVVFLHMPATKPLDVSFGIKGIEIERKDNTWVKLSEKTMTIRSTEMTGDQILLIKSIVPDGEYSRLKIRISEASVEREKKRYSLALPRPDGDVIIDTPVSLRNGESRAIFLEWDPDTSISGNFLFNLSISAKPQKISPQTQLLYVANSGANYISVIDRFENRVVGIITVGKGPTGLVLSREGERLFVLNSGSNSISIIETYQDYVKETIQLVSGIHPVEMAMIPDTNNRNHGKLYITNRSSNDVTVVDTFMKSQLKNIKVGNEPIGITANPERQEVYVANTSSNSISIIDSLTDTVEATISVGTRPQDVLIVGDSLYVFNTGSNRITVIDIPTKTITRTIFAEVGPRKGIYSSKYNRIYLSNVRSGRLSFLIPSSSAISKSIKVGENPIGLAIDENRNRIYVTNFSSNTVTVVNPISELTETTIEVGENPYSVISLE